MEQRHNIKESLDRLVRAYPDKIRAHDNEFLILRNGVKLQISDGRTNKTFEELLEEPDIDDMFYARYPLGAEPAQPARNIDPGRVRFEPLFVAMYGDCSKNEVAKNLRTIRWLPKHAGGSVAVTAANDVATALEGVSHELDELPDDLIKYVKPLAGTYNCRKIAGTKLKSMYAYMRIIGGGRKASRKPYGGTKSRQKSCGFLKSTALSGAAIGTTTTPCISNIGRN